jgi:hypothetical protein
MNHQAQDMRNRKPDEQDKDGLGDKTSRDEAENSAPDADHGLPTAGVKT